MVLNTVEIEHFQDFVVIPIVKAFLLGSDTDWITCMLANGQRRLQTWHCQVTVPQLHFLSNQTLAGVSKFCMYIGTIQLSASYLWWYLVFWHGKYKLIWS